MERITGLISANYETKALGTLTQERTIASLPYGGRYRMIDFPLSNMVNSGIQTVGIITPYKYRSIIDHIGAGKDWSLDRKNGGLFILPGTAFGVSSSLSRFPMRDFISNDVFLKRSQAEYVLITTTDEVYNMDYRPMVEQHIHTGADLTLMYREAVFDSDHDYGLNMEGDRITGFTRGVHPGDKCFRFCFVLRRTLLLEILQWFSAADNLGILEALSSDLDRIDVRGYHFPGYVRSISTAQEYFHHSMELLQENVRAELFSQENPIMTKVQDSMPTRYYAGSDVRNSLIPAGCSIQGRVENSILFRGVRVEKGAVVRNSIVMQSCVVKAGAFLENTIIDRGNIISEGMVLKGTPDRVFVLNKKKI